MPSSVGHLLALVGYDKSKRVFVIANSYGVESYNN